MEGSIPLGDENQETPVLGRVPKLNPTPPASGQGSERELDDLLLEKQKDKQQQELEDALAEKELEDSKESVEEAREKFKELLEKLEKAAEQKSEENKAVTNP
jgi:hypothetical protein